METYNNNIYCEMYSFRQLFETLDKEKKSENKDSGVNKDDVKRFEARNGCRV